METNLGVWIGNGILFAIIIPFIVIFWGTTAMFLKLLWDLWKH